MSTTFITPEMRNSITIQKAIHIIILERDL